MSVSRRLDLLLLSMPFGPVSQPSIGLELLRASVPRINSRSDYLTLAFAQRIGLERYERVTGVGDILLAGDWIFRRALFGADADNDAGYLYLLRQPDRYHDGLADETIADILAIREEVEPFLAKCMERVLESDPRVIGFTSSFQQHVASLALAQRLRAARPDVPILMGGANCESVMGRETARHFPFLTAVVSGEADLVFRPIIEGLLAGKRVEPGPGVFTLECVSIPRAADEMIAPPVHDMDALPIPDYTDFFAQWNASGLQVADGPRVPFECGRGCWWGAKHHCTFCGLNGSTMAFRAKTAGRVQDELTTLTRRHPGSFFTAVDNILDMHYFDDLIPELARSQLDGTLFFEVKANLRRRHLQALREAGVVEIQPGIEHFSTAVLQLMRKGVTGLQNVQLLKWAHEYGLRVAWNHLWGFPGEEPAEYDRIAAMIPLLTHLPAPFWHGIIHLQRFSPNFVTSAALGFTNVAPMTAYQFVYPFDRESLGNLAYYFQFDYQHERDVAAYTSKLRDALRRWKAMSNTSVLLAVEKGEDLWVVDTRPAARAPLTVLRGAERAVYLACDGVSTIQALQQDPDIGSDAADAAAALVDRGLMLREGNALLSLALRPATRVEHVERHERRFLRVAGSQSASLPEYR
jgi:ribosomal peptide maturation radical SAM protein 1